MSPKKRQKFLIIDGHALIHRSFHALPLSLKTSSGEVVNAVYGFASFLLKAIKDLKPDMIALALDKKGPTFRHESYKDYKATRVKAPDELYAQIPRVRELAECLNIPVFEIQGCEADDVIGTLTAKIKNADKIIVTGDMDTLQLVDNHTKVYTMSRGFADSIIYDEKAVSERYGIQPDQVIEYKALRGDPSDNIPGVKGIGEKTAVELLQEFGTIKNLYKNIKSPKISDRIRQLLIEYKEDALMSHDLATIRRDISFPINETQLHFGGFDREKALSLFKELEFKSLMPRLIGLEYTDKKEAAASIQKRTDDKFSRNVKDLSYTIIEDGKAFESFFKKFSTQKIFAFDTETSGFDCFTSSLLGISVSWKVGEAYFLSIRETSKNLKL
jgi:DNA polymerase-1